MTEIGNHVLAGAFLAAALGFLTGDASGAPRPQAELINRPTHPFVCPVDESYGPWRTCDKEYGSK